jgi:hypothetical protein
MNETSSEKPDSLLNGRRGMVVRFFIIKRVSRPKFGYGGSRWGDPCQVVARGPSPGLLQRPLRRLLAIITFALPLLCLCFAFAGRC